MDIFESDRQEKELLLKKYRKRITTGQVIIYVVAIFTLIASLTMLHVAVSIPVVFISMLLIPVLLLVLNMLSYWKPFIALMIATAICGFSICTSALDNIFYARHTDPVTIAGVIVQMIIVYFVARSSINGRNYEQLKKEMANTQPDD